MNFIQDSANFLSYDQEQKEGHW